MMSTPAAKEDSTPICQINWTVQNKVIQFSITGIYTPDHAAQYNACLLDILDKATVPLTVMIDCSTMKRPTNFEVIRQELTFMNHPMVAQIYIASVDRLVRFSMMVIFNAAAASVRVFDSFSQAQMMLDTRSFKRI